MAPYLSSQKIQENLGGHGADCAVDTSDHESFFTIDLNRPIFESTLKEMDDEIHLSLDASKISNAKNEARDLVRTTKRRFNLEEDSSFKEGFSNLDLSLKLSPPKATNAKDEISSETLSSLSSQASCLTLDQINLNEAVGSTHDLEAPLHSLVLMGCGRCLMYAMVSEVDPKCPNCEGNDVLVDEFRGSLTKKRREI